MDFDDLCATYFPCKTKISHLYEIVIFQAKLHFLDSEKEKEAEGGGFGPGAYINGSAVSQTVKSNHSKQSKVPGLCRRVQAYAGRYNQALAG